MNALLEHFRLLQPEWLFLLLALIPLFFFGKGQPSSSALLFPTLRILGSLGKPPRERPFRPVPSAFFLLCLLPAIIALARPVWQEGNSVQQASGIDIIIALDISASMDADDFHVESQNFRQAQTRLDVSKKLITDFIHARPHDRIGLISFATHAYATAPLTLQHHHLIAELSRLRTERDVNARTAIGTAIAAAANRLDQGQESKSKVIILVTDGENNAGALSPKEAATHAATLDIKIYPIAIFTEPEQQTELVEIAQLSGGQFFQASTFSSLQQIFRDIDQLEKSEAQITTSQHHQPLHPPFLLLATLLLLCGLLAQSLNPPAMP